MDARDVVGSVIKKDMRTRTKKVKAARMGQG
jgi:hypothetical protein